MPASTRDARIPAPRAGARHAARAAMSTARPRKSARKPAPAGAATSAAEKMSEYSVDELAHIAGTTVRNVRTYQDRGVLPPPEKRGRKGFYNDTHLARLRLIGQLLQRGYTL